MKSGKLVVKLEVGDYRIYDKPCGKPLTSWLDSKTHKPIEVSNG